MKPQNVLEIRKLKAKQLYITVWEGTINRKHMIWIGFQTRRYYWCYFIMCDIVISIVIKIYSLGKLRLWETYSFAPAHRKSKQQCWDFTPRLSSPKASCPRMLQAATRISVNQPPEQLALQLPAGKNINSTFRGPKKTLISDSPNPAATLHWN